MEYDCYNLSNYYKPKMAGKVRDILHRRVLKGIPKPTKVLEVGVGFAEFAKYCKTAGIEYVGLEPNESLRKMVSNLGFKVYDGRLPDQLEVKEKNFDLVFIGHVLEHLPSYKEVTRSLENLKKLLKPDGYVIVLYPDASKSKWLFYHDYTHQYVTTPRRMEMIFQEVGLKVIESKNYVSCLVGLSKPVFYLGKFFPFYLFPGKKAYFWRLSLSMNGFIVGQVANSKS
jgi:ubiquinone/menaquinone biosynthesis C-methylase UbiE